MALKVPQGVYLYLGYSEKDEKLLKSVTNEGALEAVGAIQGLVRYHNVNSNKVKCDIHTYIHIRVVKAQLSYRYTYFIQTLFSE